MKKILSIVLLSLIIFAGTYFLTSVNIHRQYHGKMNIGIGRPYQELVNHLYDLSQQKKYTKLGETIEKMKNQSQGISDVWLIDETLGFRNFVKEIIKE